MSKPRQNKLDPFRERIRDWDAEGKTLAEIVGQLRTDGFTTSVSSVGDYLQRMRTADAETKMFELIATGGQMNKEITAAYAANPAPEAEQLISVCKTLIMSLQVHGAAEPGLLRLSNSMQKTVLSYMSGKTKASLEERRLAIDERKLKLLEDNQRRAKEELQKLRDPKAAMSDEDRAAIVNKVDEILGIK